MNTKYIHKVDKSSIPVCNIMGVNIAAINMKWLLRFTEKYIQDLSGDYMCVTNVHTVVTSYENVDYCVIQNDAILSIPDGGPLSSIGRHRGYKEMHRTTGPSYLDEIMKISVNIGWRHFFYGSTNETLEKLKFKLERNYPGINIVGMYSPPFRSISTKEDKEIVDQINQTYPDFVWVGLGAPKQERWMAEHQGIVRGFMVGVGAAFDYFAGNIRRAPEWMQKSNMEWLYRLLQDPKRLFLRYFYTNTKFLWYILIKGK